MTVRDGHAKIVFEGFAEIEVPVGTSLLQAAEAAHAPEGSSCGGVCGCSTCHVHVLEGQGLLSEMEDEENDILDKAFDVKPSSRLGCQAKIERAGTVLVRITRESIEAFESAGRPERVAEERAELAVVQGFLPSLADEATTRAWVQAAIAESGASSAKELGKVMGALMKAHKGEVDGNLARKLAAELLG